MLNHVDVVGVEFECKDRMSFYSIACGVVTNKRKLAPLMSSKNALEIPLRYLFLKLCRIRMFK